MCETAATPENRFVLWPGVGHWPSDGRYGRLILTTAGLLVYICQKRMLCFRVWVCHVLLVCLFIRWFFF